MPSPLHRFCIAVALSVALLPSARTQSLHVESPGALAPGLNHATIDSFGGDHYWSFIAQPGSFKIQWTYGGPQEGFGTGGHPLAFAAFGPKTPGAVLSFKEFQGGTTFSGTVTKPTRVVIEVSPTKSALVRQTTAYTLEASGNVSFASGANASASPSVVGIYGNVMNGYGVAKFTADGNITTTTGATGHWELFDAESRTYVIMIGRDRWSAIFQPGRGFVDGNNGILLMEMKH